MDIRAPNEASCAQGVWRWGGYHIWRDSTELNSNSIYCMIHYPARKMWYSCLHQSGYACLLYPVCYHLLIVLAYVWNCPLSKANTKNVYIALLAKDMPWTNCYTWARVFCFVPERLKWMTIMGLLYLSTKWKQCLCANCQFSDVWLNKGDK